MIDGIDDGDGDCNSWIISQLPQWRISETLESKTHVTLHQTNNRRAKTIINRFNRFTRSEEF